MLDHLKQVISIDDAVVDALAPHFVQFPPSKSQSKHCVRCHKSYDPNYNNDGDCTIQHDDEGEIEETYYGATGGCGCSMSSTGPHWDVEHNFDEDYCYSGTHTTEPKEVEYSDWIKKCKKCPSSKHAEV
jgi:hypothetical protein